DLVLPACTQFERNDIDIYGSYSNRGVLAMHKLVDPLFHSRSDFDIFTDLCRRFGRDEEYRQGLDEMGWVKKLYDECREANKSFSPAP
ncbi:molybdopterin-dependent oxidoreductase, partial [Klebsiella pneumoniae]